MYKKVSLLWTLNAQTQNLKEDFPKILHAEKK